MTRTTAERLAASVRSARPTEPPTAGTTRRARATAKPAPSPVPAPTATTPVRTDGGEPPSSAGERFPRRVWPD